MKKFYVGSGLENYELARFVIEKLEDKGFINTYDWTRNKPDKNLEKLRDIGIKELNGVLEADFVAILLPGGKGTHTEFGIALGYGKKVYLYSQDDSIYDTSLTSTFYHLPEVNRFVGRVEDFVKVIVDEE